MATAIPFEEISLRDVVSLWNKAYPAPRMTTERVSQVLEHHFDAGGSFAAVEGRKTVGCVLSQSMPEIESDSCWFVESPGAILAVLVDPSHRRQGIGSHLMKLAESRHVECGRMKIVVGTQGVLPGFFPGVDSGDITARVFLTKLGYRPARTSVEMRAGCSKKPPKKFVQMEIGMLAKGIAIVSSEPGDEEEYVRFLRKSARRADPRTVERWEESPEGTVLARKGLSVIGAATAEEALEGEFVLRDVCVAAEERGNGVGSALLARVLRLCGANGARSLVVFSAPGGGVFFGRFGFLPGREWLSFVKPLKFDAGERWKERYRKAR